MANKSSGPVTEIRAARGLIPLNLHELWEYRDLVYFLVWREVKGRYRQMALGPLWMIVSPLLNMVLFTIVFGVVAKLPTDGVPYPIFNYAALLPWTFFTGVLFAAANSLVGYRELISKVYFPRLVIPLVGVLSSLFDFAISCVILFGMCLWYRFVPGWTALIILPVYLALAVTTGLAVGLWAASWIVHYRDVNTVLTYVVRVWMYATPVVYAASMVPERWRVLYNLNPMTVVVDGVRNALLGLPAPSLFHVFVAFATTLLLTTGGAYYFRRTERSIVDIA